MSDQPTEAAREAARKQICRLMDYEPARAYHGRLLNELAQAFDEFAAAAVKAERERIIENIRGIASITRLISPVESRVLTQMANAIESAATTEPPR